MRLPVPKGHGRGFGSLPHGSDIAAVIALSTHAQLTTRQAFALAHLALALLLLVANLRLPWPRLFAFSVLTFVGPVFLGNVFTTGVGINIHPGANDVAQAAFATTRRLAALIYGFAWLYSTSPARSAAVAVNVAGLLRVRNLTVMVMAAFCLFPRMAEALRAIRVTLSLRPRAGAGAIGALPRPSLARRVRCFLDRFRHLVIALVLRLGRCAADIAGSVHTYGTGRADRARLPRLESLRLTIERIDVPGSTPVSNVRLHAERARVTTVSGADADKVTETLAFCARVVPNIRGTARGRYEWNGIDLSHPYRELSDTAGRIAFVGRSVATGQVGVTLQQQLLMAGASPRQVQDVAGAWTIADLLDREISSLSGGQQTKCQLAALEVAVADLLVLDNPAAELDSASRLSLKGLIGRKAAGAALILSDPGASVTDIVEVDVSIDAAAKDGPSRSPVDPPVRILGSDLLARTAEVSIPSRRLDVRLQPPLAVRRGEMVALTGPNGSGKSSLLNALAGALASTPALRPPGVRVGYLQQHIEDNLVSFSVGAELGTYGIDCHRDWAGVVERFRFASALAARRSAGLDGLSTLERQLLCLVGMATGTDLLLLDEPDAHLSNRDKATYRDALLEIAAQGVGILIATHSPALIASCDRVTHVANPGQDRANAL